MCCGLWLERDYGKPARELMRDAGFVGIRMIEPIGFNSVYVARKPRR